MRMLDKCRLCRAVIKENRSAHLRDEHGIDSRFKGAIKQYFVDSRFSR